MARNVTIYSISCRSIPSQVQVWFCHYDNVPRAQPTYTPTAMNYDFALITLKAPVDGPGWLGLTAGSGNPTYSLTTAGYPGEKPSGTMWMSTCSSVAVNFAGNQGVFTDIDQCQSQARALGGGGGSFGHLE